MRRPRYRIHGGFRMPLGFPAAAFESALAFRPAPGDLLLTTYPKCGTTWVQHMLYMILAGGEPLSGEQRIGEHIPHLEEVGAGAVAALALPRVIKTHLPLALAPYRTRARYVYVARNPFDCVVSFYHHTRGFERHYDFADGTFDDFFECFIEGEVDFGDYFDHLVPWSAFMEAPNVLFLTYERIRAAPAATVLALGRFLGPAGRAVEDPSTLERIVEGTSFERMRREQARWSSLRPASAEPFVRRGVVGDWERMLAPGQARRLAAAFRARTAGTPAATLWPDIVAAAERGR